MAPKKKLHGVNDELLKLFDSNMDDVSARRRAREAFKGIQLGVDHILFKVFWFSISFLASCSCMLFRCRSILDIRFAVIFLVFEVGEFYFLLGFNDFYRCSFSDTNRRIEDGRGNI